MEYGFKWFVTFPNSDWWVGGARFFEIPDLLLMNMDGVYPEDFTANVVANTTLSTFNGTNAMITVGEWVTSMAGFEQQSFAVETASGVMIGTFAITYNGQATGPLPVNASASEIETALETQTNVGDVMVYRRNERAAGDKFTIYIVFVETLGNVEMLGLYTSTLRSSDGSSIIQVSSSEVVMGTEPVMESKYKTTAIVNVSATDDMIVYTIEDLVSHTLFFVLIPPTAMLLTGPNRVS